MFLKIYLILILICVVFYIISMTRERKKAYKVYLIRKRGEINGKRL